MNDNDIEEFLKNIKIESVIGEHVRLINRPGHYLGKCPFHKEETPSFSVNKAKQVYHCFGCGLGGDAIQFVMKHKDLSFDGAIQYLKSKFIPELHVDEEDCSDCNEDIGMRNGMITDVQLASKVLPGWFVPRMMDDVWNFGLLMVTGDILAIEAISAISVDGKWLEVRLLTEECVQTKNYLPKQICATGERVTASVQVAHVVAAFELAYT